MADASPDNQESFVIQHPENRSENQPLKVHHLSHDLRGPLNSILGFTELLLEGIEGPINDIQAEDLAAIQTSARNLLQLINNVVDLSKLADNQLRLTPEAIDLRLIFDPILSDITTNHTTQAALRLTMPDAALVWGDYERVSQMVANLVYYLLEVNPQGENSINVQSDDQQVTIQLIAHNVWLPPAQTNQLFELEVHVDAAGRSELGAGGLALPLTRQLAQHHQGWVGVEIEDQIGTIFLLKLPRHQPG